MGFMSRSIMVFDTPRDRTSAFGHKDVDHSLQTQLIMELRSIAKLHGYFKWDEDAVKLYETWWVARGGPPVPQAKRLAMGYNSRRDLHFFKIAMAYSLARSDDLLVTVDDTQKAISLLLRTENRMKHIFTEMNNTGAMVAMQDVLDVIRQEAAEGRAVNESALVNMLMQRFQPTQVHATIENMVQAEMIKDIGGIGGKGFRQFGPGAKLNAL